MVVRDLFVAPAIDAEIRISREAIKVSVLALVLLVIAPEMVISLPADTVCRVVAPLKLLAFTVSADVVLRTSALFVMVTAATLLLVFSAVTLALFTKLTVLVLAEIAPLMVMVPEPPIDVLAAMVTAPLAVTAVALELIKAPLLLKPAPLKLKALAVLKPFRSAVKPELTVTKPLPNAPLVTEPAAPVEEIPALTKPPDTVVPPVCVLAPDKVTVPPAALTVNKLEPETTPENVAANGFSVSVLAPVVV